MNFDGPVPGIPDAVIRSVRELPEHLEDGECAGGHAQAKPGRLLLNAPNTARFLVRDGTIIEIAAERDADPGMIMLLLNGSARGALIHQRGELPLHAATLAPPGGGGAFAICGDSGAGKSTLAAELSRRGWVLLADDTTRVSWNGSHALAWPSRDSIKLWRDACDANGLDVSVLERVTSDLDKYYWRVPARSEPLPLATVVELSIGRDALGEAVSAAERMSVLTRHAYRQAYIRPLGRQADFVRCVAQTASVCRILQLPGARARSVRDLADAVEALV